MTSKGGRPSLLTTEVHTKIVDLIRAGNLPETAAAACGVARPTLRAWMLEGAQLRRDAETAPKRKHTQHQADLLRFLSDLDAAFAQAEAADVLTIRKHSGKDWRAAAWALERRNRQNWSLTERDDPPAGAGSEDSEPTEIAIFLDRPPST